MSSWARSCSRPTATAKPAARAPIVPGEEDHREVVRRRLLLRDIKVPDLVHHLDCILNFIHHKELDDVLNRKYMEIDRVRQEYPHLVALFKKSSFPSELANGLSLALEDFGDAPLIVRSSSLLEDRLGAAFSGKYKSLFLGNQGSKEERLAVDAVAEVYAPLRPDPTNTRRAQPADDEEMGIMISRWSARWALPAGVLRRGLQQQRVPLVGAHPAR
jgi:hypothetical protein